MTVGVVGAGVTGLAVHHELARRGVESVVFEATAEPGGMVRSNRVDGYVVEAGPQRTRLTPGVAGLVEELGLEREVREAADLPLFVYHHGKLREVPQSPSVALTTDLLSWRGKARVFLEPFTDPPREDETVAGYLTRAFGHEVADYYFGPLYGGLYGSRPEEMYVRHSFARALRTVGFSDSLLLSVLKSAVKSALTGRERPPVATFESGMQALPRALSDAHADDVHLETPVNAIREAGDGYLLDVPGGEYRVDDVVVTTPADVSAALLEAVAPDAAERLVRLTYNPMVLAYLVADCDREAAGYQIQFDEPFRTLGVTFNHHLLGRDGGSTTGADGPVRSGEDAGVYTCFLGGAKTPAMVEWGEDRLLDVAVAEFERVTGCAARPLGVRRLPRGMPAYDTSWTALDDLELPDGVHLETNFTDRAGLPGRIRSARATAERLAAGDDSRERTRQTVSGRQ